MITEYFLDLLTELLNNINCFSMTEQFVSSHWKGLGRSDSCTIFQTFGGNILHMRSQYMTGINEQYYEPFKI